jgi:hypothetical protein
VLDADVPPVIPPAVQPDWQGSATQIQVFSDNPDPVGTARAQVFFNSDGTVSSNTFGDPSPTQIHPTAWIAGAPTPGVGSDYQIEIVRTGGDFITGETGANNWQALPRTLDTGNVTNPPSLPGNDRTSNGTVRIRSSINPTLITATINWFVRASVPDDPSGCFAAGSQVLMSDGTTKAIEHIVIGDVVAGDSGYYNEVEGVVVVNTERLYSLNRGSFFVTAAHPFLTVDGWKAIDPSLSNSYQDIDVGTLEVGDQLITTTGYEVVTSVESIEVQDTVVYTLQVNGNDTFIVDGYVVHNK